jgi:hypothetical protein
MMARREAESRRFQDQAPTDPVGDVGNSQHGVLGDPVSGWVGALRQCGEVYISQRQFRQAGISGISRIAQTRI